METSTPTTPALDIPHFARAEELYDHLLARGVTSEHGEPFTVEECGWAIRSAAFTVAWDEGQGYPDSLDWSDEVWYHVAGLATERLGLDGDVAWETAL